MNMNTEPIRLPAWVWALLALVLPPVIALLLEQDWKVALATSLGGLLVGGGAVAKAESKRAFTNSPATVDLAFEQAVLAGAVTDDVNLQPTPAEDTPDPDLGGEPPIAG